MNSFNKYIPLVVFVVGLVSLVVAMRTFFHPPADMTPIVKRPVIQGATATIKAIDEKKAPALVFRPPPKPEPSRRIEVDKEMIEFKKRPAVEFLKRLGLKMTIPDGYMYFDEKDGDVDVLVGTNESTSRYEFFLFVASGKHPIEKASSYLKTYFDDMQLKERGRPQPFHMRAGFKDTKEFKGTTSKGSEFHVFYFQDPSSNRTMGVVFMGKQLSRQPARLRDLVNSIQKVKAAKG